MVLGNHDSGTEIPEAIDVPIFSDAKRAGMKMTRADGLKAPTVVFCDGFDLCVKCFFGLNWQHGTQIPADKAKRLSSLQAGHVW